MNISHLSVQKARAVASHLRTSRRHGGGWSPHTDRDLAREANEIHVMAQSSHDRII